MSSQAHRDDTALRIGGAVLVAALVGGLGLGLMALADLAVDVGSTRSFLELVVAVLAVLAGARQLRRPTHRDPDSQSSSSDATR